MISKIIICKLHVHGNVNVLVNNVRVRFLRISGAHVVKCIHKIIYLSTCMDTIRTSITSQLCDKLESRQCIIKYKYKDVTDDEHISIIMKVITMLTIKK